MVCFWFPVLICTCFTNTIFPGWHARYLYQWDVRQKQSPQLGWCCCFSLSIWQVEGKNMSPYNLEFVLSPWSWEHDIFFGSRCCESVECIHVLLNGSKWVMPAVFFFLFVSRPLVELKQQRKRSASLADITAMGTTAVFPINQARLVTGGASRSGTGSWSAVIHQPLTQTVSCWVFDHYLGQRLHRPQSQRCWGFSSPVVGYT